MGNAQKKPHEKSVSITTQQKQIVLHYTYKIKLPIAYSSTFPHHFEGLKLWDSNIAMARYVVMNTHRLKNNSVLQMPTGTGIVSISVRKWTQAKKLVMVDTSEEVVGNAKNNCLRNKTADYVAVKMKWDQYSRFSTKYDVILASDPFFHRCSPPLMVKIAEHFLVPDGLLILAAPNSTNLQNFLKLSEESKFEVSRENINSEEFMNSPLYNQVEGQKEFPQLCKGEILIYVLCNKKYPKALREQNKESLVADVDRNIKMEQKRSFQNQEKKEEIKQQQVPTSVKKQQEILHNGHQHIQPKIEPVKIEQKVDQQYVKQVLPAEVQLPNIQINQATNNATKIQNEQQSNSQTQHIQLPFNQQHHQQEPNNKQQQVSENKQAIGQTTDKKQELQVQIKVQSTIQPTDEGLNLVQPKIEERDELVRQQEKAEANINKQEQQTTIVPKQIEKVVEEVPVIHEPEEAGEIQKEENYEEPVLQPQQIQQIQYVEENKQFEQSHLVESERTQQMTVNSQKDEINHDQEQPQTNAGDIQNVNSMQTQQIDAHNREQPTGEQKLDNSLQPTHQQATSIEQKKGQQEVAQQQTTDNLTKQDERVEVAQQQNEQVKQQKEDEEKQQKQDNLEKKGGKRKKKNKKKN